jgi:ATP-dependent Clp protease ATP-binding subunit ClpA
LNFTSEVIDFLGEKGYDPNYGARPLKRAIQKYLQDPLSYAILKGGIADKETVQAYLEQGEIKFKTIQKT